MTDKASHEHFYDIGPDRTISNDGTVTLTWWCQCGDSYTATS